MVRSAQQALALDLAVAPNGTFSGTIDRMPAHTISMSELLMIRPRHLARVSGRLMYPPNLLRQMARHDQIAGTGFHLRARCPRQVRHGSQPRSGTTGRPWAASSACPRPRATHVSCEPQARGHCRARGSLARSTCSSRTAISTQPRHAVQAWAAAVSLPQIRGGGPGGPCWCRAGGEEAHSPRQRPDA